MAHFYLHMRSEHDWIKDPDGSEFPSLEEAKVEALASARDLLAARIRAGEVVASHRFEITNRAGDVLAMIPFLDSVELTPLAYNQLMVRRSVRLAETRIG